LPSFGEQLRQARESQNITLQEIAATTKISSRSLQALESEQFDQLPGGIFNKGFVRAYARYVGLDEEKMLAAYLEVAKHDASSDTDMVTVSNQIAAARKPAEESRIGGTTLMGVLAVIVALVLGGLWYREHRREVREQAAIQNAQPPAPVKAAPQPAAPAPQPVPSDVPVAGAEGAAPGATGGASPPAAPAGTPDAAVPPTVSKPNTPSGPTGAPPNSASTPSANATFNPAPNAVSTPPSAPANASPAANKGAAAGAGQPAPVMVSLSATQKAWISVTSDGNKVESLTLDPEVPELRSRSYKAKEKLKLVVGNAGGVTAVVNGKQEGSLGPEGQPMTITFTAQGIVRR
jgi:cytoskeleton protein RodZ